MNTTYFLNQIMGNVFGSKKVPALPEAYYLGLSSTDPAVDGTGVTEPERTGTGYARIPLNSLSVPENGQLHNTAILAFPESLASWGVMTNYVIYDAAEGGNLLVFDRLSVSRTVEVNTVVAIKPESLSITLSNPVEPPEEA